MINVVEENVNWEKVQKAKQQLNASKHQDHSSSFSIHKHAKEEGASIIKDVLSGVDDPMDLLNNLDKKQQKKEKAKKNQQIIGAPGKKEAFRSTSSSKRNEDKAQAKITARDRRLEKEAITKLEFAIPFQDDDAKKKNKQKKAEEREETAKEVASKKITTQFVASAIEKAQKKYPKEEALAVREVASAIEELFYKTHWEHGTSPNEPFSFLNDQARDSLSKYFASVSDATRTDFLTFAFETIYSEKGAERFPSKCIGLKILLQLIAKQAPSVFTHVVIEKFPHENNISGKGNVEAIKNLSFLLLQIVDAVATAKEKNDAVLIYIRLLMPLIAKKQLDQVKKIVKHLMVAFKQPVNIDEKIVSPVQLSKLQALVYTDDEEDEDSEEEEEASEDKNNQFKRPFLSIPFDSISANLKSPVYFDVLFDSLSSKNKEIAQNSRRLIGKILVASPDVIITKITGKMINYSKQCIELLQFLQTEKLPSQVSNNLVKALAERENIMKNIKKKQEVAEFNETLQGFAEHAKETEASEKRSSSFLIILVVLLLLGGGAFFYLKQNKLI